MNDVYAAVDRSLRERVSHPRKVGRGGIDADDVGARPAWPVAKAGMVSVADNRPIIRPGRASKMGRSAFASERPANGDGGGVQASRRPRWDWLPASGRTTRWHGRTRRTPMTGCGRVRRRWGSAPSIFIEMGVGSLVNTMANGQTAEVGTIGNEGVVGLPLLLERQRADQRLRAGAWQRPLHVGGPVQRRAGEERFIALSDAALCPCVAVAIAETSAFRQPGLLIPGNLSRRRRR